MSAGFTEAAHRQAPEGGSNVGSSRTAARAREQQGRHHPGARPRHHRAGTNRHSVSRSASTRSQDKSSGT